MPVTQSQLPQSRDSAIIVHHKVPDPAVTLNAAWIGIQRHMTKVLTAQVTLATDANPADRYLQLALLIDGNWHIQGVTSVAITANVTTNVVFGIGLPHATCAAGGAFLSSLPDHVYRERASGAAISIINVQVGDQLSDIFVSEEGFWYA